MGQEGQDRVAHKTRARAAVRPQRKAYVENAENAVLQDHVALGPAEARRLPDPPRLVRVAHGAANLFD